LIPYTYLIGWTAHNKWYYGSRYAKKCHPSDLWKLYFTSSAYVKQMREEFGEPDVIQVRKTFESVNECRNYEHRVLQRLRVVKSSKWLNKTDVKSIPPEEAAKPALQRRWYTNGTENVYINPDKQSIPEGFMRGRRCPWVGEPNQRSKVLAYSNGKDIIFSETLDERPLGKEWRKIPVRGLIDGKRKTYTNGIETRLCFDHEVPDGWYQGRHWSQAGENNSMFGRKQSEETKQKIREKRTGQKSVGRG
jgi:hypothetical protein